MKAYMALSCKEENYYKVLDMLLERNLSKNDIHLLFGRFNILGGFHGLKNETNLL